MYNPFRLVEQKRKYHAKVLSDDAITVNFIRTLDTFDHFADESWYHIDIATHISTFLIFTFAFDSQDIEQLQQIWKVELPSLDEQLEGILVKFEKVLVPELKPYHELVEANIREEYFEGFKKRKEDKGRYGISRYGYAYYDPINVMRFIANVIPRLFIEKPDLQRFKEILEQVGEQLGISKAVREIIFNRIALMMSALQNAFLLGMGLLGTTRLPEKEKELVKVPTVTYDDKLVDAYLKNLEDVHFGFILGITPLGYGYLVPKDGVYRVPSPELNRYIAKLARDTQSRYVWTAWAFANYSRPEERRDFRKSERADQYLTLQMIRRQIESIVDNLLEGENVPANLRRQYKNAVMQLLALRTKRHKWGYTPFRDMSDEELKNWWITYWSRQGLKLSLLEKIYSVIGKWLKEWERVKYNIQQLVKLRRKFKVLYR